MLRVTAAVLLLTATLAPAAEAEWAAFRNDSRNTGTVPNSDYPVFVDVWWNNKTLANAQIKATPVLKDQILVVADMAGLVRALDAESGTQLWSHKMSAGVEGTPTIAGERVYVADLKGLMKALNLKSGAEEHAVNVGATRGSITFHENKVFVGNEVGEMKAFLATTLTLLWTFKMSDYGPVSVTDSKGVVSCPTPSRFAPAPIRGSPAVFGGKVYFGTLDKYVFAVDDAGIDGGKTKIMWSFKTNDVVVGAPAISVDPSGNRLVVGSYDGKIYALPVSMGGEGANPCYGAFNFPSWTYDVPNIIDASGQPQTTRIHSSPGISEGRVIFGATNGKVYALQVSNGASLWNATAGTVIEPVTSSPTIAGKIVVIGSEDKNVYWLDATNGRELKRFPTQSAVQTSAAIDGVRAFIAAQDGTTYMFGPEFPKRPDLAVESIQVVADGLSIVVRNDLDERGLGFDSGNTTLRLFVDDKFLANVDVPVIPAGKTQTIRYNGPVAEKSATVRALADPDATVQESDESNNEFSKKVSPYVTPSETPDEGDGEGGGFKIPGPGAVPTLAVLALALLAFRRRR